MRESCIECVMKHLGQAAVLMDEVGLGYPIHKWRAVGHLGEAESEAFDKFPALAHRIRDERKIYMSPDGAIEIDLLIKAAVVAMDVK